MKGNDVGSTKTYKGVKSGSYEKNMVYLGNLKDHQDSEEETCGNPTVSVWYLKRMMLEVRVTYCSAAERQAGL